MKLITETLSESLWRQIQEAWDKKLKIERIELTSKELDEIKRDNAKDNGGCTFLWATNTWQKPTTHSFMGIPVRIVEQSQ